MYYFKIAKCGVDPQNSQAKYYAIVSPLSMQAALTLIDSGSGFCVDLEYNRYHLPITNQLGLARTCLKSCSNPSSLALNMSFCIYFCTIDQTYFIVNYKIMGSVGQKLYQLTKVLSAYLHAIIYSK